VLAAILGVGLAAAAWNKALTRVEVAPAGLGERAGAGTPDGSGGSRA
jgi:hypothetical protein